MMLIFSTCHAAFFWFCPSLHASSKVVLLDHYIFSVSH